MYESSSVASKLTAEEIDAWNMWVNKQHGIMPNQYHWTYEEGSTMIYPEHIQDLLTIDKIWGNKIKYEQKKAEEKAKNKMNNPLSKQQQGAGGIGGGFYGKTYRYK